MKHIFILLSFITLLTSCATQQDKTGSRHQIPILAWYSIPEGSSATLERYQELRDCGFTHTFSHTSTFEDAKAALDLCAKTGLKSVLRCSELYEHPEQTAQKVRNHKGLGCYFLQDEPRENDFEELGAWARRIQSIDNTHPCYLNLLPTYGGFDAESYAEYIRKFDEKVNLPQISYDFYPIIEDKGNVIIRDAFWLNLELISAESRKVGKPFWAFALAVAHLVYPIPNIAHLRLQLYADLAYGAQCLQYFTYWTPDVQFNYHQAPITLEGKRSPVYELVRNMNQEIQKLAFIFLGCHVESVFHTGTTIPEGTKRLTELPAHFLELDTEGNNALISTLTNNGHRYIVIQNTSIHQPLSLQIQMDNMLKLIRKDGSSVQASKYGPLFIIPEGDILIFEN